MKKTLKKTGPVKRERGEVDYFLATFNHSGLLHVAIIMNMDAKCLEFSIDRQYDRLKLDKGEKIDIQIRSSFGGGRCVGKVISTQEKDNTVLWKVQFTKPLTAELKNIIVPYKTAKLQLLSVPR